MAATGLVSNTHEVEDAFAANELFQSKGWTDGLPIVPPTADGVRAFLDAGGVTPDDVVGVEPVRRRRITAATVAARSTPWRRASSRTACPGSRLACR